MLDNESSGIGLEQITAPVSPRQEADEKAKEEATAQLVGPSEYHQQLTSKPALHRTVLTERESDRLNRVDQDCKDLTTKNILLTNKYTKLSSDYSRLRQAYDALRANFGVAAVFMASGGVAVSIAGAIQDLFWKPLLLWSGITGFTLGLILTACNLVFVRDRYGPETPTSIE